MGNGIGKLTLCFTGTTSRPKHDDVALFYSDQHDDGLGHSFCYVRPENINNNNNPARPISNKVHSETDPTVAVFRSISGASVSANTATPLTTAFNPDVSSAAAAFESSTSFASIPLQPIPRHSGPLQGPNSGPIVERWFMSGPIERGFLSGPLDRGTGSPFSGPLEKEGYPPSSSSYAAGGGGGGGVPFSFRRSRSHSGWSALRRGTRHPRELIRTLRKAISKKLSGGHGGAIVAPVKPDSWIVGGGGADNKEKNYIQQNNLTTNSVLGLNLSSESSVNDEIDHDLDHDDDLFRSGNLQWAQGKAGEDRVHVVVSEEHGWVFVGIYDGFNGPDATDFLLSNLYPAVHMELKGLLWDDDKFESSFSSSLVPTSSGSNSSANWSSEMERSVDSVDHSCPSISGDEGFVDSKKSKRYNHERKWSEWDRERVELDRRLKEQLSRNNNNNNNNGEVSSKAASDSDVLKALSRALKKTEESYLDIADKMLVENPELNLMGSCVLVMLMKGEDVYVMNVGDSRAVLAQTVDRPWKIEHDLARISEETFYDPEAVSRGVKPNNLNAFQLTSDHSTSIHEEVQRIRKEHRDDAFSVTNDRVKGSLKVTRAFGAGFLKQPKWNNALLEMFRIDYVGNAPYINCEPCLRHHRLGPKDRFLILSSDGLYQYFTNEEAVTEVETFISMSPEGDPAQHLVEELLFRAAKKAGMDFYELLEIPQGDRRRYHDDVSIIVISFEGRIWRSCA